MKRRRKRIKKGFSGKKRLAVLGISVAVILVAFVAMAIVGDIFVPSEYEVDTTEKVDKGTGKINVLIVGLDKSESLTDTIMVASYDLDNGIVNILSVPRDTRMYIGSRYQKINAAYSVSKQGKKNGVNGTIEAVTRLTSIPINYYVEFTVGAFRECVDALGGVEFDVPQNMNYDDPAQDLHIHLQKGQQHLDGDKAEQLVRFRRYTMGDIDRVAVQQSFLKELARQKLTPEIITKLPDLFNAVRENLRTNFTLTDIMTYALNIADLSSENINMYSLPGSANGTDYGSSYWIADMNGLSSIIRDTFGYDPSGCTIHAADGTSISKDVKITPKETAKPTVKPTASPKASTAPASSPKATQTPAASEEPTVKPTVKPTETPNATQAPSKEPEKTEKPQETGIKRPSANTEE